MAKILTTEEKARRYDEIIEKLRSLHDDYDTVSTLIDIKEELENILPELKVGKDERIRKALHIYLDWLDGRKDYQPKGDYTVRDMIAWLEKQGEKPTDEEMKETLRTEYEKGRADVIAEMQNPAWSQEDERIYQSILDDTVQENQLDDKQLDWLKFLKDRYAWKPSDEQMKQLGWIANQNKDDMIETGIELIAEERQRQIEVEGYDAKHDADESTNRIVAAAVSYAMCDIDKQEAEAWWSWDFKYWKPKDRRRNLVRAGALIAAAIDRLQMNEE